MKSLFSTRLFFLVGLSIFSSFSYASEGCPKLAGTWKNTMNSCDGQTPLFTEIQILSSSCTRFTILFGKMPGDYNRGIVEQYIVGGSVTNAQDYTIDDGYSMPTKNSENTRTKATWESNGQVLSTEVESWMHTVYDSGVEVNTDPTVSKRTFRLIGKDQLEEVDSVDFSSRSFKCKYER